MTARATPKAAPFPAVIVDAGESLSLIAHRELGDARGWVLLARINNLTAPDIIQPGDLIVVGGVRPVPRQRPRGGPGA